MTRSEARNVKRARPVARPPRGYRDLHEHLDALREQGLLLTIDRVIDKDAELHPLVRWQFVGGIDEAERKAFLFTNVVDGRGRKYDMPVVVGAIAANRAIYSIGMDASIENIATKWDHAIANPVPPRLVTTAPCQEVVLEGDALQGEGNGLDRLPIPISTPGFDSAPTLTATNVITRDPETGVQNMGTYRAALKAPDRLVVRMATRVGGAGGYQHYLKHQQRGDKTMPCAIVLGCPPYVAFMAPQKLPLDVDEIGVAGGLAGAPINVVRARTVDLLVPAEAEIVIEGLIDTEYVEPEAPFGESHGHVALEEFNMPMRVTAITHRKQPIVPSYISQVDAERVERDQARGLRAAVSRALAQHARHPRRQTRHAARAHDRAAAHPRGHGGEGHAAHRGLARALRRGVRSRATAARSASRSMTTSTRTTADALFWAIAFRMNPVERPAGVAVPRPGPRSRARARGRATRTRPC